ncbi:hypothetical protein FCM35_KLT19107 [Carex littledalei]|uniref:Uncharacterized protein n=1 Tax=Carex littledalei TaxID=544730 RepID=A0A833VF57_9POAL|nr:hypothetical protein FCM35_KLT19107 [Carex littledalei]
MKALRLAQLEYRLEMFQRVYWGLEPAIKLESDGIFVIDSKKNKSNRGTTVTVFSISVINLKAVNCQDDDIISDDSHDCILKPTFLDEGEPDFESGRLLMVGSISEVSGDVFKVDTELTVERKEEVTEKSKEAKQM